MSDHQHGSVLELLADHMQDLLLSLNIDVGSGLIKENNLVGADDGSSQAEELSLT
jgi:hypothetical protein